MARKGKKPEARSRNVAAALPAAHVARERLQEGLSAFRRALWFIVPFSVVVNLLALTIPLYLMQVTDRVLVSRSIDTLLLLTLLAIGAVATFALLDALRRVVLTRVAARFELALGGEVLASSLEAATRGAVDDAQGLRDLSRVRSFIAGPVVPLFVDIPMAPLYLLVVFMIHPHLGWITLAAAVILLVLAVLNQLTTAGITARASVHEREALAAAEAQMRNAEAIKAMGMMPQSIGQWGGSNASSIAEQMASGERSLVISGLSKFARLALQIGLLGWGAYLVIAGELTAGMIIAASLIGSRALQPVEGTIEGWRTFLQVRQAYRRLADILAFFDADETPTSLPEPKGEVVAEKLMYAVPGTRNRLVNGATFGLRPGDAVAVVGPSGAGKSTLARLLIGALEPTAGTVRLDGADLSNWDRIELGRHVGYVPQDVELFPGTVAYNIARLREDADAEHVTEAAGLAGVHKLISRLPGGYDTKLRVGGAPLSGGQRQQVALARAFYGKPKFVVLDEPDSNLDTEGQQALSQALLNAKAGGVTTVTVTQRLPLLQVVDKILVMQKGRMEMYGPRETVLARLSEGSGRRLPSRARKLTASDPPPTE